MVAAGKRFAVVVSRWNELVTKQLLEGALDELARFGADHIEVVRVPGTWEHLSPSRPFWTAGGQATALPWLP